MSAPSTYAVRLTDDELLLLDGRCSPEVQADVVRAKERRAAAERFAGLTEGQAAFVAEAVREASGYGALRFSRKSLSSCRACGRRGGYAPYKSGRNKGQPNYGRPLHFRGIDLSAQGGGVVGYAAVGCCDECYAAALPSLREALADVRAELPEAVTGRPPEWRRHDRRRCLSCQWEGHEGEMGRLPVLMGPGTYPGECPQCHAKSLPLDFRRTFESAEGFALVPTGQEATA